MNHLKTYKKTKKNTIFRIKNSPGQRPEACLILCLSCFKSISLIIVRSQGPRWAKLGCLDNPWICLDTGVGGKSLQNRLVALLGRPKRRFWPLQLPTVLCTRFWKPPGSILGAILASTMFFCRPCFLVPWVLFWSSFFHRYLLRVPPES